LWARRRLLALGSLGAGVIALGIAFVVPPTYTARAVFLPPQQQQSLAATALSSLGGALGGIASGLLGGGEAPEDQYVGIMQGTTVADRMIRKFDLMKVYDEEYLVLAEKKLADRTDISIGKKDGLITVEVDDHSPQRAAAMANQYIEELRTMTATLAVSSASQQRVFFEQLLDKTKDALIRAQLALQSSGVSGAMIKTDPGASAETYAGLREQEIGAQVRLETMRTALADGAPEVQQQQALVNSLQRQISALALPDKVEGGPDYVSKFREFKYQETLFEVYARQYEMARADEARQGVLIQVVDPATPPELKSKPKRALIAIGVTLLAFVLLSIFVVQRAGRSRRQPAL
jgi:uncharacterized protein involved in exopolysaccharide biosynthesis